MRKCDANTGADEDSEDESELSEVESDFEYKQNEEVNAILIQKLNKEIELEIERETFRCEFILCLN